MTLERAHRLRLICQTTTAKAESKSTPAVVASVESTRGRLPGPPGLGRTKTVGVRVEAGVVSVGAAGVVPGWVGVGDVVGLDCGVESLVVE